MSFKKVVVGISGGVDSSVAAFLLKQKGYSVSGVFMKNWDEFDETGQCTGEKDLIDAHYVCKRLGIELTEVNFVKEYWNEVFGKFLEDYQNGLTPNPDILCNRHIKFDQFFKYAMGNLHADAIATGHYARTSFGPFLENYSSHGDVRLLKAADNFKDQTFFLAAIKQNALRRTIFPLGTLLKAEVKNIAKKAGLSQIATKKESTGICFIGNRNFRDFIKDYIDNQPGSFIDVDTGKTVGSHNGIHQWTVGQRCRLSSYLKPYFVIKKDLVTNQIIVAAGTDHPALFSEIVITEPPSWISQCPLKNVDKLNCKFRFQHTKPLVNCTISYINGGLKVILDKKLRAITPGQYAVFYLEDECLGCSRIIKAQSVENELDYKQVEEQN